MLLWVLATLSEILSLTDSNEPSLYSFTLHFHHSHLKQRTRICNYSTIQATLSGSGWFRACCKDRSWRPAADRGQIYQSVIALLGTGKVDLKFNSSIYYFFGEVFWSVPVRLAPWLFKFDSVRVWCLSIWFMWDNSTVVAISLRPFYFILRNFLFKYHFSGSCWNIVILLTQGQRVY